MVYSEKQQLGGEQSLPATVMVFLEQAPVGGVGEILSPLSEREREKQHQSVSAHSCGALHLLALPGDWYHLFSPPFQW